MELLTLFRQNWQRICDRTEAGRVLLAVSGGQDSMVMTELFRQAGIPTALAHCNFSLREEASDLDEALVRDYAAEHGLPFHSVRFDTRRQMDEWKKGVQETARILRYEWLEHIRKTEGYKLIATAHHADDNAETMLMQLFRGTGIRGMHGIPERQGNIVRPLLFAQKNDIATYAEAHQVPYRDDASNATDAYKRNIVRHHIMPAVQQWFPDAVKQMYDTARRLGQAGQIYDRAVAELTAKLTEQRGQDVYIPVRKLMKVQPLETVCYELFAPYGFTPAQMPQLLQLLHAETGHFVSSPSHRVIRHRDFLVLAKPQGEVADMLTVTAVPCSVHTANGHFHFSLETYSGHIPTDPDVAYIDMRRVSFPLILRRWRTGDYFYPLGMGMKKKKLSRFFIDRKIPLHEKEQVWVLETGRKIAWVAGMRVDERFRLGPGTQEVLVVRRKC
jgi:tRNA(Ile)-lysidine synthase